MKIIFALFLVLPTIYGKPFNVFNNITASVCGYESCPTVDTKKINVHLVCHSHDDIGWLKTAEQYFYQDVQNTLNSVVLGLKQDPKRRFIQVETYNFRRWWMMQDEATKQDVINLVNEGRLEMINTGWSMNDEAVTHYQSTIDQFTLGHRYLDDIFGKCARPKIGWQIDTFGHSREQASIYAQMGYDAFFFTRFDYRDSAKRQSEKTMDFMWSGSDSLGSGSNIFTSIIYRHYSHPPGFCFDLNCGDQPINDDEESPDYNEDKRVSDFTDYIKEQAALYPTNNILITMGDDFQYQGASTNFANIDKLIKGFQKLNPLIDGKEINIMYSTPSCYTKAVNDFVTSNDYELNLKLDDFLPHTHEPRQVWTGFYTSRPTSKRYERTSNNILQIAKQLAAVSNLPFGSNFKLEEAIGVMQHHDALTGTERQMVVQDYDRILSIGVEQAASNIAKSLTTLLGLDENLDLHHCPLANISICPESKKDEFNILLYNPLARKVSHHVQIPVDSGSWTITDPEGKEVTSELFKPIRDFSYASKDLGEELNSDILNFQADLPAMGLNVYKAKKTSSVAKPIKRVREAQKVGFEDTYVNLDDSGFISGMTIKGISLDVKNEMMAYKSDADNSGAYVFSPDTNEREAKPVTDSVTNQVTLTDTVIEIRQEFVDWIIQIVRIFKDEDYIELDWVVGPIDVGDGKNGREIISRFTTNLDNKGVFYTDANSRQFMRREKDKRPTYTYTNEEPQSGNYYPVTSRVAIKDEAKGLEFAVLTDRPEGASSLDNGQLELMIHRATLHEELAQGEHLYEMEFGQGTVARGSHHITIGETLRNSVKSSPALQRDIAQRKHLEPWVFYTSTDLPKKSLSFLNSELPENVHLLTLDKWSDTDNTLLIRLEHFLDKDDDSVLSKDATVDLSNLFATFSITSLKEVTINAIIPLDEVNRLQWPQIETVDESRSPSAKNSLQRDEADLSITLTPMQIRTFIATIKNN